MKNARTAALTQPITPPQEGVRAAVLAAVAHTLACPVADIEQEIARLGEFTVKSVPAHAVLARLSADLGVTLPNPSRLSRTQFTTVSALVELVLTAQRGS